jgi:hypothetical protein
VIMAEEYSEEGLADTAKGLVLDHGHGKPQRYADPGGTGRRPLTGRRPRIPRGQRSYPDRHRQSAGQLPWHAADERRQEGGCALGLLPGSQQCEGVLDALVEDRVG